MNSSLYTLHMSKLVIHYTQNTNRTRKLSIPSGDNAYMQDIVTCIMFIYASGVNYHLNSNHTNYLAQTLRADFLRFGKFPPQNCESCGAIYQQHY